MRKLKPKKRSAKDYMRKLHAISTPKHGSKTDKVHSINSFNKKTDMTDKIIDDTAYWLQISPDELTKDLAQNYLNQMAYVTVQQTVNNFRNIFNDVFGLKLNKVTSNVKHLKKLRYYTAEQVDIIIHHQSIRNAKSTKYCYKSGLRAHELATLIPGIYQPPSSHRYWRNDLFIGIDNTVLYAVTGKGKLIRNVAFNQEDALELESFRLKESHLVRDRKIYYIQHYNIGFGQAWSQSFTSISKKYLGWSGGGHSLRYTYLQNRFDTLLTKGLNYNDCLLILSQELGHFRKDVIKRHYL